MGMPLFLSHFLDILDSFVFWEGIGRGLLYGMFIVYLSYVEGCLRLGFFVSLVEKYYIKLICNVLFGNIIY